jgi:hypothetical protein
MAECAINWDDFDCAERAKEAYNKHADECRLQDCYAKQEAAMADHFEKCDNMGPMED